MPVTPERMLAVALGAQAIVGVIALAGLGPLAIGAGLGVSLAVTCVGLRHCRALRNSLTHCLETWRLGRIKRIRAYEDWLASSGFTAAFGTRVDLARKRVADLSAAALDGLEAAGGHPRFGDAFIAAAPDDIDAVCVHLVQGHLVLADVVEQRHRLVLDRQRVLSEAHPAHDALCSGRGWSGVIFRGGTAWWCLATPYGDQLAGCQGGCLVSLPL
jgi:hypothetical protein